MGSRFTALFLMLFLLWLLLSGSFAADVLVIGVIICAIIAAIFMRAPFLEGIRLTPKALGYSVIFILVFIRELFKSNIAVAKIVLAPSLPINPGIVEVKTRLKSPIGRLALANSITLTPGTLTVDIEGDSLFIHWIDVSASDIEGATQAIVSLFEKYLEVIYG